MGRKPLGTQGNSVTQLSLLGAVGQPHDLLSALFRSSAVGVAICDKKLRFRAINDALASMNGIPAAAHIGKTLHAVLGEAAEKIVPAYEQVFASGQPVSNFEVSAKLPRRNAPGHWNESYFPIKDEAGQVLHVGAVVLELTKRKDIDAALFRLTEGLTHIKAVLRDDPSALRAAGLAGDSDILEDVSAGAGELLESCLLETRVISQLLRIAPHLDTVQPVQPLRPWKTSTLLQLTQLDRITNLVSVNPLSAREQEVAAHLATGKSNKQIASMLIISTRTVESHRARIMLKLDLHSVSDLVRYAVRNNLIQP
jgi:DNA-binding CsgD family transcriptional regulator